MSMETIHDRHDWIVKLVLGRPANMRSLLQAGLSRRNGRSGRLGQDRLSFRSSCIVSMVERYAPILSSNCRCWMAADILR